MAEDGRTILAVDDETALLDLMAAYLARLGYETQCCSSASVALALLNEHPLRYALLIADVRMPDMAGPELALRARALNPAVSVLLTSGSSPGQIPLPPGLSRGTRFLQKPFSPSQLAEAVESSLTA
jgi:CheY-like chemotaxis protein